MAAGVSAWTVAINILTRSNFGLVTSNMARQAASASATTGALNTRMSTLAATTKVARVAITGFGLAAAATMAVGIKGAADLQDALTATAISMGRSTDFIDAKYTKLAMRMSNTTAQSVTNSMQMLAVMASSGLNDPEQLRQMAVPISLFADTQYLNPLHPMAFNTSAALAAKLAHQMGARTAADITPILNTLFKIGQDMPDSLTTAATQLGYYTASYRQAGVNPQEILMLQATLDRMGYGSRQSGRGMQMILRYLENPTKKMGIAQDALGIGGFIDPRTGVFNVEGMLARLNADYHHAVLTGTVGAFNSTIARAFPANAVQIASALSSDAGRAQRSNVERTLHRVKNMDEAQRQMMTTLNNQTKRLITNFATFATMLGRPLIEPLTRLVSGAADLFSNMASFFYEHKTAAKVAAGVLSAFGVAGIVSILGMGHLALHAFQHLGGGSTIGISRYSLGGVVKGAGEAVGTLWEGAAGRIAALGFLRGLGALALRFVPLVGWVMLAVTVVKLFNDHAKQIGKTLGWVAAWIVTKGIPDLKTAFTKAWTDSITAIKTKSFPDLLTAVVNGFTNILNNLVSLFVKYLNPFAAGGLNANLWKGITDAIGAAKSEYNKDTRPITVKVEANYTAPSGSDDAQHRRHAMEHARRVAASVADVLGSGARTGSRTAGSNVASVRMSHYETQGALA